MNRPCYVAVFGPQASGKTSMLGRLSERVRKDDALPIHCISLDLSELVLDEPEIMFAQLLSELRNSASEQGIHCDWSPRPKAEAADLDSMARAWLRSTNRHILLCIDHVDSTPRALNRLLLRALRAFSDQAAVLHDFNRLGIVLAGAATLYEMHEELYSILVLSEFFTLPPSDEETRQEMVNDFFVEQGISVSRPVVQLLARWAGGEWSYLESLISHLRNVHNLNRLTETKLRPVLPRLKLESFHSSARDLALWLAIDDEFRRHVRDLSQSGGSIPARRIAIDVDLYQLYGGFVRVGSNGGDAYVFRNLLISNYLSRVLGWLEGTNLDGDPELIACVRDYASSKSIIEKADNLREAAKALANLWPRLTTDGPAELFFMARPVGARDGQSFHFVQSDIHALSGSSSDEVLMNILRAPYETPGHWVQCGANHLFAVWTVRRELSELRIVAMINRRDRRSAFSEVALGHWFHLLRSVADRLQNLFAREIGWRFIQSINKKEALRNMGDRSKVFVVHGRNDSIRKAMFSFLRSIGLQPLEWNVVVNETGKGAPTIDEILKVGFGMAQAAVVLLTGDDEARMRSDFLCPNDAESESVLTPQARPNVLYEAGMAMGRYPDRTILVEIPPLRPFTDIAGIYTIRMDNSTEKRQILANGLERVGCDVQLKGTAWHTEGDFSSRIETKAARR